MDIQQQVAARRAALAEQAKVAAAEGADLAAQLKVAERAQREEAVEQIAAEISVIHPVRRNGETLELVKAPLPPFDIDGLKRSKVDALLKREARTLWTPEDNWIVISCISGGIALLHLAGIGLIPLLFGAYSKYNLDKKYLAVVRQQYPELDLLTK
jgi:hypothetical protein